MSIPIQPHRSKGLPGIVTKPLLLVPDNHLVIALAGKSVFAWNTEAGPSWHRAADDDFNGVLVAAGTVYCVSGPYLYTFDLVSGAPQWPRFKARRKLLPPAQSEQHVILVDIGGTSYLVDKENGPTRHHELIYEGAVTQPPVIVEQTLIYAAGQYLFGADVSQLSQLWRYDFSDSGAIAGLIADQQRVLAAFCSADQSRVIRFSPTGTATVLATDTGDFSAGDMALWWLSSAKGWSAFGRRRLTDNDDADNRLLTILTPAGNVAYGDLKGSLNLFFQQHAGQPVYCTLFDEEPALDRSALLVASESNIQVRAGSGKAMLMNDYAVPLQLTTAPLMGEKRRVFVCGTDTAGHPQIAEFTDLTSDATFNYRVTTYRGHSSNPIAVAIDHRTLRAYVPNNSSLTVIDLTQDPPVFSSLPIPEIGIESQGVAVGGSGSVYIAATAANRLVIFDPSTEQVTRSDVVENPRGIAIFEFFALRPTEHEVPLHRIFRTGEVAFVTSWAADATRMQSTDGYRIGVGRQPSGIVARPGDWSLFVANQLDGTLSIATYSTLPPTMWDSRQFATAGARPFDLALSSDGRQLYVTNRWDSSSGPVDHHVRVIALDGESAGQVIASIDLQSLLFGLAVVPQSRWLLVACQGDNTVKVIDTATNTLRESIPVGEAPQQIAVTPDGKRAVVANYTGQSISIIDIE